MKRILALVLSVLMLASCFAIATSAEEADLKAVYAGAQTKSYTANDGDFYDVRFLATLDESALTNKKVVFNITANYADGKQDFVIETNTAYVSVLEGENPVTAAALNENHEYLCAVAVKGISKAAKANVTFTVNVSVVNADDEILDGEKTAFTVNDGEKMTAKKVVPTFQKASHAVYSGFNSNSNDILCSMWAKVANKNTFANFNPNGETFYSRAMFVTPTVITELNYYITTSDRSPFRAVGASIMDSVNGTDWTLLGKISSGEAATIENFKVVDGVAYNYIKIEQTADWLTYGHLEVIGISDEDTATPKKISYDEGKSFVTPYGPDDPSTIWNSDSRAKIFTSQQLSAATAPAYVVGKFETATKIDRISYYVPGAYGSRARNGTIEVSVDGETWVKVVTLPVEATAYTYAKGDVYVFDVDDNTEYNYIRIVQSPGLKQYYWSVGTVVVY